ncbi:outer membrane beta-barrel family protein [Chryseobacterium daecheongense]|uniref:Outer membrane receptor protein involved in Fe transport n=1 Tax=Chryseobacterium daecheongense TaxID=192389 RepID=A0A3N0W4R5_9FLAO|nr:outer membrane beta-barrel family protein [Chryseobacterium daecheongense]ROI00042.1 TonB-dependent receptor [Chryseobacterium daecheongense]TDX95019.1 outer membrane receptor protein involved in Fe transport [Chryseobacterium daecheongense]
MKTTLSITILFFLGLNSVANAQSISGKITNSKGQAIPYAEVSAEYQKEKFYAIADNKGYYNLKVAKNNDYTLNIFNDGVKVFTERQSINGDINKDIVINDNIKTTEIQGVVVTSSRKKLIEQKVDRLVYNVENSIASQGMSAADALKNTPLLRMDDMQGLSIAGKSNVNVMINGKMLNLSGSELTNYLQSLRSDDISKIEVITTPPAKYEAQGNSGLINIILKRNTNFGWSGTLNSSYQRNTKDGFRNGININYRANKFNTSLKLRHYDNGYTPTGTRDLISSTHKIYTEERREDRTYGLGLNYSVDYEINKKSNIGFIYDYGVSKYTMDSYNKSTYVSVMQDSILDTHAKHKWKTPTHTLSAYYDLKLDSLGKKLSVVGNFLNNRPDKINNFITSNLSNFNESIVRNTSLMKYNVYSGQADLTLPFGWGSVETGAKYTFLDNNSDVRYYNYLGGQYIIDPENSNLFKYREHNYALYVSYEKSFGEKWTAKAGLRYEYTKLNGSSPNVLHSEVSSDYGKLFPSIYVSYNPNENNAFSINYSRRITRPDFQSLNPFRWYTNPYMYYTGNSALQPSFNDNVEVSYTFKNKLTISAYNQYTKNGYSSIARFSDGIYSNIKENSYNENKLGLNVSYYDTFFKVWEFSGGLTASHGNTKPLISELQEISVSSLMYYFYNTITVNKSKTIHLMLNFWHSLPFSYGSTYIKDQLEFSPGIKASLFDKQLQLSAVVSDVFRTVKNRGYTEYTGYRENFSQYNDYRRFTLSFTYTFGNKNVKGVSKNIRFEDKNRAN